MSILAKVIYRFSDPDQNPIDFFLIEVEQTMLNLTWNCVGPKMSK